MRAIFGRHRVVEVTVEALEANHESAKARAALTQALLGFDLSDPRSGGSVMRERVRPRTLSSP
jgi:hypothetical protein